MIRNINLVYTSFWDTLYIPRLYGAPWFIAVFQLLVPKAS
jgi:hypothetical protein